MTKFQMDLINKAKELGLSSIKFGDTELHFNQSETKSVQNVTVPDLEAKDILAPPSPFDDLTDQDILYWSTPYFEELQAEKTRKQEVAKEQVNG